jgi:hypothetical protein
MAASVKKASSSMSVRAYRGDAKTLLAFDLLDTSNVKDLAGFTIECRPEGKDPYLHNMLQFRTPGDARESGALDAYVSTASDVWPLLARRSRVPVPTPRREVS